MARPMIAAAAAIAPLKGRSISQYALKPSIPAA